MKEKPPLPHKVMYFQILDFETWKSNSVWGLEVKFVENYFFLEHYVISEGAVSHNVLYYQPLTSPYYMYLLPSNVLCL